MNTSPVSAPVSVTVPFGCYACVNGGCGRFVRVGQKCAFCQSKLDAEAKAKRAAEAKARSERLIGCETEGCGRKYDPETDDGCRVCLAAARAQAKAEADAKADVLVECACKRVHLTSRECLYCKGVAIAADKQEQATRAAQQAAAAAVIQSRPVAPKVTQRHGDSRERGPVDGYTPQRGGKPGTGLGGGHLRDTAVSGSERFGNRYKTAQAS